MSLILDALRRADRERKLGQTPDLKAVYEEDNVPARNGLRPLFWVFGAFMVGAVIVGLILWPWGQDPGKPFVPAGNQTAAVDPGTSRDGNLRAAPAPPPTRGEKVVERKKDSKEESPRAKQARPGKEALGGDGQGKKVPETVVHPTPDSGIGPSTGKSSSKGSTGPAAPKKARPPSPPAHTGGSHPAKPSARPGLSDQNHPVKTPPKRDGAKARAPTSSPRGETRLQSRRTKDVPLLASLGPEIREKVGKIEINIHSYSKNPAERLVFINMHKYGEGERIGEKGPILKEITPEGVIIDYGGGEARVNVWR